MRLIPGIVCFAFLFVLQPDVGAETCTQSCHNDMQAIPHPHQPVLDGDCLSCHARLRQEHPIAGGKSFALALKGAELCEQCHEAKGQGKSVHAPVAEGDCLGCHRPHGAANPFLLDVGANLSELCFSCHEPFAGAFIHGPVAVGACIQCHSPHASGREKLLKDSAHQVCLGCHDEFAENLSGAKFLHPPVKNGACTDCHDPHASAQLFYLKEKMPDLCLGCHTEVRNRLAKSKFRHTPVEQEGSCGNCHSTHYSEVPGLLAGAEKDVCFRCHGSDSVSSMKNIQKEIEEKENLHGPINEGKCSPCHDPHGSDFNRLLTRSYPAGLYASYAQGKYDLCLQCHEENLLRFEDTTLYTAFRNGKRNLHFVHVADKRKGRTCRACHETHASNDQHLISKEGMPFGNWKIPVGFLKTATGGSCAPGCHRPLAYDRTEPVTYPVRNQ
ncbi:MAG: cytochrome c3 family protein [Desulfuromonadales bacterium]